MSRITVIAVVTIITAVQAAFSGEKAQISGRLAGELAAGAYIVRSTIVVPEDDSLFIPSGTSLYFDSLTGINVHGSLTIAGTVAAPVVLTSVNDTAGAPAAAQAFDWNGIKTQSPLAALRLRHAVVSHSVYGVSVRDTEAAADLDSVIFDNNGYASLVRGEEIVAVRAGEPFSAKWNIPEPEIPADTAPPPQKPSCRHKTKVRVMINISALTVTAAGIALYAVNTVQMNTYFNHYSKDDNSNRLSSYYEGRIRGNIRMGAAGAAAAGVGLGCLAVSVFF
ncbi:MAG: hypothetical protein FWB85_01600 [Chitinispirillia bacterium]|nr:hypothetical protein [Chitinispirillia bacterium]MCL2241083.1 hypothetical protein [Chitinispirillia bacterium]